MKRREREGRGSETGLRGRYRRRESWLLQGRSEGWQAYRSEREAWLTADEAVTRDESRRDAVRTEKLFPSCHHLFEGREGGAGQPAAPPLSYMRVCAVFVRVCGAAVATIRQGIVAQRRRCRSRRRGECWSNQRRGQRRLLRPTRFLEQEGVEICITITVTFVVILPAVVTFDEFFCPAPSPFSSNSIILPRYRENYQLRQKTQ